MSNQYTVVYENIWKLVEVFYECITYVCIVTISVKFGINAKTYVYRRFNAYCNHTISKRLI